VALAGEDKFTCQAPNGGVDVTYDYVYVPHFTASPKSFDFQPFSCNPGYLLTTGTYRMYAEAEDSSGTVIGTTPAQTYQFTPEITLNNVVVPESSYGVDTGLILLPGDTVTFTASGQIWAGVLLTGTNGPQGWVDYAGDCDPKFPLVCAPPYGLIGSLAAPPRRPPTRLWGPRRMSTEAGPCRRYVRGDRAEHSLLVQDYLPS
jgi:hypothetical protein